jgi:hypothetical protein
MSRDMRKAIITALVCGIAWWIVGATLAGTPQSIREWGGFLFLAIGWFAIGFGLGGGSGYYTAHKEDKEKLRDQEEGKQHGS